MVMKHAVQLFAACLIVLTTPSASQSEVFRLFYRFGFGQGRIGDPDREPSQSDVEALICATNEFLSDSMRNYTKNQAVQIYANEIDWGFDDWIYNGSEPEAPRNVPVIVNFTAVVTTNDGSGVPSHSDMWEATKYFDYFSYVMNYVWNIPDQNFFTDARGMWYEPSIEPPVAGKLQESSRCPGAPDTEANDAPGTPVPTDSPATPNPSNRPEAGVPSPTSAPITPAPTTPAATPTSSSPTKAPETPAPTVAPIPGTPGPTERVETPMPTAAPIPDTPPLTDAVEAPISTDFPTNAPIPGTPAPTQRVETPVPTATPTVAPIAGTPEPTKRIETPAPTNTPTSAPVPVTPEPTERIETPAPTSTPTAAPNPGTPAPTDRVETPTPTNTPTTAPVPGTPEPTERVETPVPTEPPVTSGPTDAPSIAPVSDPTEPPVTNGPTDAPTLLPGTPSPTDMPVTPVPVVETQPPQDSQPTERPLASVPGGVFGFGGNTRPPREPGREVSDIPGTQPDSTTEAPVALPTTEEPVATPPPTETPVATPPAPEIPATSNGDDRTVAPTTAEDEMVYFRIQIDFFDGMGANPSADDVEGMVCQVNKFFKDSFREARKDSGVESYATNIDWEYEPEEELPFTLYFTSHTTDGQGKTVPAKEVYDYILSESDAKLLVTDYIWNSEPYPTNQFYQTEDIGLAGKYSGASHPEKKMPPITPGKMARATCPA